MMEAFEGTVAVWQGGEGKGLSKETELELDPSDGEPLLKVWGRSLLGRRGSKARTH